MHQRRQEIDNIKKTTTRSPRDGGQRGKSRKSLLNKRIGGDVNFNWNRRAWAETIAAQVGGLKRLGCESHKKRGATRVGPGLKSPSNKWK